MSWRRPTRVRCAAAGQFKVLPALLLLLSAPAGQVRALQCWGSTASMGGVCPPGQPCVGQALCSEAKPLLDQDTTLAGVSCAPHHDVCQLFVETQHLEPGTPPAGQPSTAGSSTAGQPDADVVHIASVQCASNASCVAAVSPRHIVTPHSTIESTGRCCTSDNCNVPPPVTRSCTGAAQGGGGGPSGQGAPSHTAGEIVLWSIIGVGCLVAVALYRRSWQAKARLGTLDGTGTGTGSGSGSPGGAGGQYARLTDS